MVRGLREIGALLKHAVLAALSAVALALPVHPFTAAAIKNEVAVFAALDKVTGRIQHLEIPINQTVEFGALRVTPRVCNTRPLQESPTASFVEVDEVEADLGGQQRIFTGWMFTGEPRASRGRASGVRRCSRAARCRSAASLPRAPKTRHRRSSRKPRLPNPYLRLRRRQPPPNRHGPRRRRLPGGSNPSFLGCSAKDDPNALTRARSDHPLPEAHRVTPPGGRSSTFC